MDYKKEALLFLGITNWHNWGYRGEGIKVLSDERVTEKKHPDVIAPSGYVSKNNHGDDVMNHIKLVLPDAVHISYPFSGTFNGTSYDSKCAEYIKRDKVHIFTTSETGSFPVGGKQKAIQDCIDAGCIFFGCAGNEDDSGIRDEIKYEGFYAIGGVKPSYKNDKYDWKEIKKTRNSSMGKELDFVTLAEIMGSSGTSFCAPIFAGMVGLVQEFFIEKTGRQLTRDEMDLFIRDNCIDLEKEGFDERTGYGLFILPNPIDIDIKKYVPEYEEPFYGERAELQIGNKDIIINGEKHTYDTAPYIKDGRTQVPIRFMEDMGYKVEWIEDGQRIIITKEAK